MNYKIIFISSLLVFALTATVTNTIAEDKKSEVKFFTENPYSDPGISKVLLDRKSSSKGQKEKKKKDITLHLDEEEGNENTEADSKPPIFPCDPPACRIIDEELSGTFCQNKCEENTKCQGRIDTRIWQYYFAVCVPILEN